MGNRDDLIAAAKDCLVELGFGATTVRDIAGRAGVSHAAIGYHFGSREALLTQALVEAVEDLDREIASSRPDGEAEDRWQALLDTFGSHRALWIAQLEAVVHAQRSPDVRARLIEGQRQGSDGLGGPVPLAVLVGLAVQSLVDPDRAPSAAEVTAALRPARTRRR